MTRTQPALFSLRRAGLGSGLFPVTLVFEAKDGVCRVYF